MSAATTKDTAIEVTEEVRACAKECKVIGYLPAILETAQRLFPEAKIRVVIEDDPEIENDRHIVVLAAGKRRDVEETLAAYDEYHKALFDIVPAPLICTFRLGLESCP